jgi:hypothetical protein
MADDKKPKGVAIVIAPKKPAEAPMPEPSPAALSEIQDQMQTNRNNKAAAQAKPYKKGGIASVRGHGCESKGKTKGRYL